MSYCDHSLSVVSLSTRLNNFSSETPGPVFFKFYVDPSAKGGLNTYKWENVEKSFSQNVLKTNG